MSLESQKRLKKLERWELAAKLAMKYGSLHRDIPYHKMQELWKDEYPPSKVTLTRAVTNDNVKWYIRNLFEDTDPIWNGSFIAGLIKAGRVNWSKSTFPSFHWYGAPVMADFLPECPFSGSVANNKAQKEGRKAYIWSSVPALYLKSDPKSISYLAGLLATGRKWVVDGETYALYKDGVIEEILESGIPIEKITKFKKKALISPFWPALFTVYMPPACTPYWLNIRPMKNAYKCRDISAILWQVYSNDDPAPHLLPYLQSRRTIFYKYKDEKHGAIKNLQRLRVDNNLISLDNRVRDCVSVWINKKEKNDEIPTD